MEVYLPTKPMSLFTPMVVICPGGAYHSLACLNEGESWAEWLAERGCAATVLSYSMPEGNPQVPIEDCQNALRVIADNAQEWNIDKSRLGLMGFSAGGHLCATVAKAAAVPLEALILMYPVIKMTNHLTEFFTRRNFLGSGFSEKDMEQWSADQGIKGTLPHTFIAASNDDKDVSPLNSVAYYQAAREHALSVTLHIYATGGHGWGMERPFDHHDQMLADLEAWLHWIGWI